MTFPPLSPHQMGRDSKRVNMRSPKNMTRKVITCLPDCSYLCLTSVSSVFFLTFLFPPDFVMKHIFVVDRKKWIKHSDPLCHGLENTEPHLFALASSKELYTDVFGRRIAYWDCPSNDKPDSSIGKHHMLHFVTRTHSGLWTSGAYWIAPWECTGCGNRFLSHLSSKTDRRFAAHWWGQGLGLEGLYWVWPIKMLFSLSCETFVSASQPSKNVKQIHHRMPSLII